MGDKKYILEIIISIFLRPKTISCEVLKMEKKFVKFVLLLIKPSQTNIKNNKFA
jgi:hypothetical protein